MKPERSIVSHQPSVQPKSCFIAQIIWSRGNKTLVILFCSSSNSSTSLSRECSGSLWGELSLSQQISIQHIPCVKHYVKPWEYNGAYYLPGLVPDLLELAVNHTNTHLQVMAIYGHKKGKGQNPIESKKTRNTSLSRQI